ncbi:hypothetical protein SMICM304S_01771 [Streptomyces microflavus]
MSPTARRPVLAAQYRAPDPRRDRRRLGTRPRDPRRSAELTALAGVLWCAPGELLAAATLREHRMSRELSVDDLARQLGMTGASYLRMEETGRWKGNERQSSALCRALGLSPAQFLTATGRDEELAELLTSAVTTRWQAYVRPVAKIVPLDRAQIQDVLEELHADYQALMV